MNVRIASIALTGAASALSGVELVPTEERPGWDAARRSDGSPAWSGRSGRPG